MSYHNRTEGIASWSPEELILYFKRDDFFKEQVLPWFESNVTPGAKVLNLGCGVDIEGQELRKAGFPHIYSLDINPQLLDLARFPFPLILPPSLRCNLSLFCNFIGYPARRFFLEPPPVLIAADAKRLPFWDETFEVVFLKDCLLPLSWEERRKFLGEARRVLKFGGFIVIQNEINRKSRRIYPKNIPLEPQMLVSELKRNGFQINVLDEIEKAPSKWRDAPTPQMFIVAKKAIAYPSQGKFRRDK